LDTSLSSLYSSYLRVRPAIVGPHSSPLSFFVRICNKRDFEQLQLNLVVSLCCSGRIPRLSLIQHSLYVGVVEKPPPPPLTGEQYGKMEPKYPEGGHCQSVLRPQGVFNVPLYFK
jgi:hypothetical protein